SRHDARWREQFHAVVASIPEVAEMYRMSGVTDYLKRVVVPDVAAYEPVYKRLSSMAELADVSSSFAMEQVQYTTALTLHYLPARITRVMLLLQVQRQFIRQCARATYHHRSIGLFLVLAQYKVAMIGNAGQYRCLAHSAHTLLA